MSGKVVDDYLLLDMTRRREVMMLAAKAELAYPNADLVFVRACSDEIRRISEIILGLWPHLAASEAEPLSH